MTSKHQTDGRVFTRSEAKGSKNWRPSGLLFYAFFMKKNIYERTWKRIVHFSGAFGSPVFLCRCHNRCPLAPESMSKVQGHLGDALPRNGIIVESGARIFNA